MNENIKNKVLSDEELSNVPGGYYIEERVVNDWHYCPEGHLANTDYEEGEEYCMKPGGGWVFRMFYCTECGKYYAIRY